MCLLMWSLSYSNKFDHLKHSNVKNWQNEKKSRGGGVCSCVAGSHAVIFHDFVGRSNLLDSDSDQHS